MKTSTETRIVDCIMCRGDSGASYTIIVRQKFKSGSGLDGTWSEIPGTENLVTSDGQGVSFLDEDRFQIVMTDEVLTRI